LNEEDLDGRFCVSATRSQVPLVRGDFFVAAASRPPLYHHVLQVPLTLSELLARRFPEIDLGQDIQQENVVRAGFGRSGVSAYNRVVEWHRSSFGYFWMTYDFASDTGRRNIFRQPLGPGTSEKEFEHDAAEIIFSLPNGLQGYMLVDAKGKRLDKGPTGITSDPRRPDRTVTNGVSCMSCHFAGIIPKADEIRRTVEANRSVFQISAETILALYPPKQVLDELFADNAAHFRRAATEVGLRQLTYTGEPIVNMSLRFEADVDARNAAAELGLELEAFISRLKSNPRLQERLAPLLIEGGTVKRDVFANEFAFAVQEVQSDEPFKPDPPSMKAAKPDESPAKTPPTTTTIEQPLPAPPDLPAPPSPAPAPAPTRQSTSKSV
jgi:hypothetical protein